jgi:DNA-binding NarL/FixJ family response regulator
MLLASLPRRTATAIRLAALALIAYGVARSSHPPGTSGRGLAVTVLFAIAVAAWLIWTIRPDSDRITPELYAMAAAGGLLVEASGEGAAIVFVFVAVVSAGVRVELVRAAPVAAVARVPTIAEISRAVHAAANHQALLDPVVHSRLIAAATAGARPARPASTLPDELTPREAEVLSLIARGLSNEEIAAALVVSEATVKTHINHVFAKIGARDRAQAVHYAYTRGLAD